MQRQTKPTFWTHHNAIVLSSSSEIIIFLCCQEVMVAGGMESMSNVPFMVSRDPPKYGGHMMEVRTKWIMQPTLHHARDKHPRHFYMRVPPPPPPPPRGGEG